MTKEMTLDELIESLQTLKAERPDLSDKPVHIRIYWIGQTIRQPVTWIDPNNDVTDIRTER